MMTAATPEEIAPREIPVAARRFQLATFLFLIPAIAAAIGAFLSGYYARRGVDAIHAKAVTAGWLNKFAIEGNVQHILTAFNLPAIHASVAQACQGPVRAELLLVWSILVGLVGPVIVAGMWASVRFAGERRDKLADALNPGLRSWLLFLAVFVLAQGLVVTYGICQVGTVVFRDVPYILMAFSIIVTLAATLKLTEAVFALMKPAIFDATALAVSREDQGEVWELVDRIALKIGATKPSHILLGLEPIFYVTAANVRIPGAAQPLSGDSLHLSLPLMRALTLEELTAIIAHELAHFRGDDVAYSRRLVPAYIATVETLQKITRGNLWTTFLLLPAALLLAFFLEVFAIAERRIGRQRELIADQVGASATDPEIMASAVTKISAFPPVWEIIRQYMTRELTESRYVSNASMSFWDGLDAAKLHHEKPELDDALLTSRLQHPTDTHPPLIERLKALNVSLSIPTRRLALPDQPSTTLVQNLEAIEEQLSKDWADLLISARESQHVTR